jgi:hypothetical protein
MEGLYQRLFLLRHAHKALSRGEMVKVQTDFDQDVFAFFRIAGKDKLLVVLNFSHESRTATLTIPMARLFAGQKKTIMKDVFTGDRIEVGAKSIDTVATELEPLDYRVYVLEK